MSFLILGDFLARVQPIQSVNTSFPNVSLPIRQAKVKTQLTEDKKFTGVINLEGLPIPFEFNSEIFTTKLSYLAPNFSFLPTIISILLTFFSSFSSFFSLQFSLFVLTIYTLLEIKLNISIVHVLQGCSPQMTTPPKMIIYI